MTAEALSAKEDQAIKGRQEQNEEEVIGTTGLMTERAMPVRGMMAMPSTEVPGPQEIATHDL
jgi:hypothetical protein